MSTQSSQPHALQDARRNDRPRAHDGSSDAETVILDATERLLDTVPLHELSVARILQEANVSRATFYFYFSSKYAPVVGLLARVMNEIYDSARPYIDRDPSITPDDALRASLQASTAVWKRHRRVIGATTEHLHVVPELRSIWLEVVERFTEGIAAEIDGERKTRVAPAGPPSRRLAAMLLWSTQYCLYVAGQGSDEDLPSETEIVDELVAMWVGTIYGGAGAAPAAR